MLLPSIIYVCAMLLFKPAQTLKIRSNYRSYPQNFRDKLILDCDTVSNNVQTLLYKLNQDIIFDFKHPDKAADFVSNIGNGTIELATKGRLEGYENLSCELNGIKSDNIIQIYSVTEYELIPYPNRFVLNEPVQLNCSFMIAPRKNLQFFAYLNLEHLDGKTTVLGKNMYVENGGEAINKGTVLVDESIRKWLTLAPGLIKSQVYLTAVPHSQRALGTYSCSVYVGGAFYWSNQWDATEFGSESTTEHNTNSAVQLRNDICSCLFILFVTTLGMV